MFLTQYRYLICTTSYEIWVEITLTVQRICYIIRSICYPFKLSFVRLELPLEPKPISLLTQFWPTKSFLSFITCPSSIGMCLDPTLLTVLVLWLHSREITVLETFITVVQQFLRQLGVKQAWVNLISRWWTCQTRLWIPQYPIELQSKIDFQAPKLDFPGTYVIKNM